MWIPGGFRAAALGVAILAGGTGRAADEPWPLWDGRETQAAYARRTGIQDVEITLEVAAGVKLAMILIPAGRFRAGGQREVTISRPFYMALTEVTQAQFEPVMGTNPSRVAKAPNLPVEDATWEEAAEFCRRLAQKTGRTIDLPTEAQWEHAYRAGTVTTYFSGDDEKSMHDHAWFAATAPRAYGPEAGPVEVATKKPNPWGLYDMAGNLNEWCRDVFDAGYYAGGEAVDPTGPAAGKMRVIKGGSVMQQSWIKPDFRRGVAPNYRFGMEASPMIIGFRIVASLK